MAEPISERRSREDSARRTHIIRCVVFGSCWEGSDPGRVLGAMASTFRSQDAKEIPMTRLWCVLTIATVLAGAAPAAAQQQPAPAPTDQGNGNWDPPPITKPTTQR